MAAAVVGGAFLSSVLNVLFERMASRQVHDFLSGKNNTKGLLNQLKIKLLSIHAVLDDAEEKQIRSPKVRMWLNELKDAAYAAGDVVDEINTEALRRKLEEGTQSRSTSSWVRNLAHPTLLDKFDKTVEPKIEEILGRLDLLLCEKDVLGLKEGVHFRDRPQAKTMETSSLIDDDSGVFGRDADREAIIRLLLSDDATEDKIDVIPIVGMGGIGKTTLAQLVYNDVRVKQHFNPRGWVCVSEEFDILRIAQAAYGSITSQTCGITILDLLQILLKDELANKKFLIVLDDVWNEDYVHWDKLRLPFQSGAHGSKIIVTTRSNGVASVMGTLPTHHLKQIAEEDCWQLFAKHAFKNAGVISTHPNLEVVGRQIVKKCKGLPLAAKTLGGLLHSELNLKAWKNILKSDIWEFSDEESKILPSLWFSYCYLPSHLKRCFAYCSIFPKDYDFTKSQLILLWMAEDLLQPTKKKIMEEVGDDYFDNLISRSFFQHSHSTNYYDESLFTMHDLINDLAKFVSGDFCFRMEDDGSLNIVSKTRYFSYMMKISGHGLEKFEALYEAKCLHSFLSLPTPYSPQRFQMLDKVLHDLLATLQFLRVLNLSNNDIKELPPSINTLRHLRYLNLSHTAIEKLPDTMCSLYKIQTLLLQDCKALVQLPAKLGRLINLRHLDIQGTKIGKMPPDMGKLKDLQSLSNFVLDKHTGHNIVELKELQHLGGKLDISGLDNIVQHGDALEANMRDKEYLSELHLTWGGDTADSLRDREVLEKLQPHTNLTKLKIALYGGTRFPGWLGDPSLSNLASVILINCESCYLLPPLGQLPSLIYLFIKGLKEVVSIGPEFYGNSTSGIEPFRSLKELRIYNMLEWQEWSYVGGIFPYLCSLTVTSCPKLTKILPLDNLQSLKA